MSVRIEKARETFSEAFTDDPDFRQDYVDNVACLIMDRIPGFKRNKEKRDKIAEAIIKLIFD